VVGEEIGCAELRFAPVPRFTRNDGTHAMEREGERRGFFSAALPPKNPLQPLIINNILSVEKYFYTFVFILFLHTKLSNANTSHFN
jgi:hypothetical protein